MRKVEGFKIRHLRGLKDVQAVVTEIKDLKCGEVLEKSSGLKAIMGEI